MANRDVTIKLTELGSDIDNVSIYKSSFTDANFIASVSRAVLMGDGYTFSVNDQISKFLLYSGEPCNATLELDLPSPPLGTTTTTAAPTTTTTTTAPTTTTTTPSATSRSFTISIQDNTGAGATVGGLAQKTFTGEPNSTHDLINTISAASNNYTAPNTISVTDNSGSITTSLTGNSSSTSRTLTSTVTIPSSNSSGVVTITGNFTQVATTTTTAAPTTTTTTAAPTTTTSTTLAQHQFTLSFTDSINNAYFTTTDYVVSGTENQQITVPSRSITPDSGYVNTNANYTVSKSGTNSSAISIPSTVTSQLSGIVITMPQGGGSAEVTVSGSASLNIYGSGGFQSNSGFYFAQGSYSSVCTDSANGYYWLDTNGLTLSTTKVYSANDGTLSQAVNISDGTWKLAWNGTSVTSAESCS